ncbi:MAG: hypothetical protein HRT64_06470 [Erythrobacter sp.]|nr:hypothetical protein [Erythrobacter sp.]
MRRFSEIVFDELDQWPHDQEGINIAEASVIAELAKRFGNDCALAQSRRAAETEAADLATVSLTPQTIEIFSDAFHATNRYQQGEVLSKPAIAALWREAEVALLGSDRAEAELVHIANQVIHGDADIRGRRKMKTRARLLLRNVVPGLRA